MGSEGKNQLHQFPRSKSLKVGASKSLLCLLHGVVSHIPLQRLVASLLRTC